MFRIFFREFNRPRTVEVMKNKSVLFCFYLIALASCSSVPESSIPGENPKSISLEPIPLTTILSALQCQVEKGVNQVESMKKNYQMGDPRRTGFKLLSGTATFTGKTTISGTDEGDASIVIPVGISEITPNVGGKLTNTATEEITRKFGITTKKRFGDVCAKTEEKGIDVGEFFSKRIVASYRDIVDLNYKNVRSGERDSENNETSEDQTVLYGPVLSDTELTLKASFSVQRVFDAGISSDILFSSTSSSSPTLSPAVAFVNDQKGEYSITLNFPMSSADTGDNRRFYQCYQPFDITYCLESPYVEQRHRKFFPPSVVDAEAAPAPLLRPQLREFDIQ